MVKNQQNIDNPLLMNRREMIKFTTKSIAGTALTVSSLPTIFSSCASTPVQPYGPRDWKDKIKPPKMYGLDGMFIGHWNGFFSPAEKTIADYKEMTGKIPAFVVLSPGAGSQISNGGMSDELFRQMKVCANQGIIPFFSYELRHIFTKDKKSRELNSQVLTDVASGKYDKSITEDAKKSVQYGEEHGGFMLRMGREMNLPNWSWGKRPEEYRAAANRVGTIFEREGADQFATFVFNPSVAYNGRVTWKNYVPDIKFVDWFALNGYSTETLLSPGKLFSADVSYIKKTYPEAPIMIAETGANPFPDKPKWQKDSIDWAINNGLSGFNIWHEEWKVHGHGGNTKFNSSPEALAQYLKGIAQKKALNGPISYQQKK
jgi:hypothetical protein